MADDIADLSLDPRVDAKTHIRIRNSFDQFAYACEYEYPMQRETRASRALNAWVDELDESGNQLRTQQDLARILSARLPRDREIAQSTVSAWCSGKSQPRGDAMVALQEIAGVQLPWWLEVTAESKKTGTEG